MRRLAFLFLFGASWLSSLARAQETSTLALTLPPSFASQVCRTVPRAENRIVWLGVKDVRSNREVGFESRKKFKDPIAVFVNPPLERVFDPALREILQTCGWTLVPEGDPSATRLGAEIEEFHANVERGLILGKGKAQSRLRLIGKTPGKEFKASVGYEIEFKKTRGLSMKRLTETLNELLAKTLEQVPRIEQLR